MNYLAARRLAVSVIFVSCVATLSNAGMYEKRLLAHLFNQSRWDAHNPLERPTAHEGKPLQVFLKCFLNQIMDMDEKNQILSTIMWLDMKWTDYHFKWDASQFANIRQINLPPNRMWKPDLLLYNSASEKFDQVFPTNLVVLNTGEISWIPPGLFHSICTVKVNWFPFDSQSCALKFGTWTYQGNTVDLKLQCDNDTGELQECNFHNDVDLSAYLAHSEWALESATIKRNVDSYGTTNQKYIDVTIYVHIQRRALYYMFNIIVPCMIMSVMSLLVFTLPPDANEKIVLGVTTLLSLTMLLQLVGDKLPQTSAGNPVLVLYFTCTIILCSLSLVFAVVLLNSHHHTGGILHVPWLIGTFVNVWLASMLRVDRNAEDFSSDRISERSGNILSSDSPDAFPSSISTGGSDEAVEMGFRKADPETKVLESHLPGAWTKAANSEANFHSSTLASEDAMNSPNQFEVTAMIRQNRHVWQTPEKCINLPVLADLPKFQYSYLSTSPGYADKQGNKKWPMNNVSNCAPKVRSESLKLRGIKEYTFDQSLTSNGSGSPRNELLSEFSEKMSTLRRLKELTQEMKYITSRMHRRDLEARRSKEWKLACRVLDRLCLVVFAALNVFTTFGILTSAPTIIKAFTSTGAPSQQM